MNNFGTVFLNVYTFHAEQYIITCICFKPRMSLFYYLIINFNNFFTTFLCFIVIVFFALKLNITIYFQTLLFIFRRKKMAI